MIQRTHPRRFLKGNPRVVRMYGEINPWISIPVRIHMPNVGTQISMPDRWDVGTGGSWQLEYVLGSKMLHIWQRTVAGISGNNIS